jgi:hypothetical protein
LISSLSVFSVESSMSSIAITSSSLV